MDLSAHPKRVAVLVYALAALPYRAATYRGLAKLTGMRGRTLIRAISEATQTGLVRLGSGFDGRRQVSLTPGAASALKGVWGRRADA